MISARTRIQVSAPVPASTARCSAAHQNTAVVLVGGVRLHVLLLRIPHTDTPQIHAIARLSKRSETGGQGPCAEAKASDCQNTRPKSGSPRSRPPRVDKPHGAVPSGDAVAGAGAGSAELHHVCAASGAFP